MVPIAFVLSNTVLGGCFKARPLGEFDGLQAASDGIVLDFSRNMVFQELH
jgi:hypothetical protein